MREAAFSKQNHKKWEAFEQKIALGNIANPDDLADMFVEVTDDLAFAQTYYPKSKTTIYLNQLAVKAHQAIYKNKKEKKGRLKWFWKVEVRWRWCAIPWGPPIPFRPSLGPYEAIWG